jgi:hypothetical protein
MNHLQSFSASDPVPILPVVSHLHDIFFAELVHEELEAIVSNPRQRRARPEAMPPKGEPHHSCQQ